MLKTKIKVGAITNLTDARYFAAREVNWLGFDCSVGSEAHIGAAQMLAIKEWVDGVKFVGEFNLESPEAIRTLINELQFDAIQLSMAVSDEVLQEFVSEIPVIKEIVLDYYNSDEDLQDLFTAAPTGIAYFLLNLDKNGFTWSDLKAGTPFSLATIKNICTQFPVLLALNYQPSEVKEILENLPIQGLHLIGGTEEKVGFKSFDEMDALLDLLELE